MHTSAGANPEFQTIRHTVANGVATIILNRPAQRNALDMRMRAELGQAVHAVRRDRGVKVLVLGGAGGAFCAGGDIGSMHGGESAGDARDRMLSLQVIVQDLLTLDRPVIAAIDGPAYGAGLGLALTADVIIASPRARFCLSFLRLGAIPDCGVFYTLPRIVGMQRAKGLAFSTREFSAEEAKDMGIVLEISPDGMADARAAEIADSLSMLPLPALSLTKRAFNASLESSMGAMLELEATGQGVARSAAFHREAAQRFVNKEAPLFQWPPG
jgi:enoyl-CoA hydratase/carnithine racemase